MKKLLFTSACAIMFGFSSNAQKLSTQGYNNGCEMGKAGDTALFQKTISNSNLPAEYIDGVIAGWYKCRKVKESKWNRENERRWRCVVSTRGRSHCSWYNVTGPAKE